MAQRVEVDRANPGGLQHGAQAGADDPPGVDVLARLDGKHSPGGVFGHASFQTLRIPTSAAGASITRMLASVFDCSLRRPPK